MLHKHHIIPQHMGGTDDPSNIIELTIEQHADAHKKLYEQHGKLEDYVAWKGLSGQINREEVIAYKCSMGGHANKDVPKSEDHKAKIAITLTGTTYTEERKNNIAKSAIGNKNSKNHSSEEYKQKQSDAMKQAWARRKLKQSTKGV
jgi:hypothetical protein